MIVEDPHPAIWAACLAPLLICLPSCSTDDSSIDDEPSADVAQRADGAPRDDAARSDPVTDGARDGSVADAERPHSNLDAAPDGRADAVAQGDVRIAVDALGTADVEPDRHVPSSGWAPFGVLSINLHCLRLDGTDFASNPERFAAIADAVAAWNVGAIAIQEACVDDTENAIELLDTAIEAATHTQWSDAWVFAHVAWEGTANEADEGLGLLVRGELRDVAEIRYQAQSGLDRVALGGTLPPALGGLRLYTVHLDFSEPAVRLAQARETAAVAVTRADPSLDLLVAGDFNATPGSAPHDAFLRYGFRDLTATLDPGRIDHIVTHRGASIALVETDMVFTGGAYPIVSDHPGVLAHIEPAPGEPVVFTRLGADVRAVEPPPGSLAVRGSVAPLTWDWGWPATASAPGLWKLVLTEIPDGGALEYKFLLEDETWQSGPNETAVGGRDHEVSPSF